ncbi:MULTISPECIES: holo-ACP synthase [unclassified Leptospira]|uniref:holo-ACP synthase n=1 Tax=unclassified Leptospira TaxID=2633828 RepID=UPI0002BD8DB2|nr:MULTISPECIES: 4'-phosphopantetheinyl transferase superfamily protein [unclassified Leptospira]EMJ99744.1 putative holo-[acyl-carrier-protein] synthase [Leptospira sp. B5-022]MCR1795243.1 4'-phosphopantetheinyl transferase superfamily protein [Leptospira sp. id769339]
MKLRSQPLPSFESITSPYASVGVDLTFIPEFKESLQDKATFFFKITFTDWERKKGETKPENQRAGFFAGRYAAKEALIKALDGYRLFQKPDLNVNYSEIEIRNDDYGRPYFRFYGNFETYLNNIKPNSIRLSISHTGDYAFSEVLLIF